MSETYTDNPHWDEAEIRAAHDRLCKRHDRSWLEAGELIAELTKPEIGPDVPVMYDSFGDRDHVRVFENLDSGAHNIRVLIPEDKVQGWAQELFERNAQHNSMPYTHNFFRDKIAAYRRGE